RLGGDEFVILQTAPGDRLAIAAFAERVGAAVSRSYWLNGNEIKLNLRIGVGVAPEHGTEPGRLLKSADLALYKGKSDGGQRVRIFSSDLDEELYRRLTIESAVVKALESSACALESQPQYKLADGRLVGFEALLRLPTAGCFIPPAVFIPVAEKLGLIGRVGEWVIARATTAAAAWP